MKRAQVYLEESQYMRLSDRAAAAGTTKSELIREAIDSHLEGRRYDAASLVQFRAALQDVGRTRVSLPDGGSYVERVRAIEGLPREGSDGRGARESEPR